MTELSSDRLAALQNLSERLEHSYDDFEKLNRALTHSSYANEGEGEIEDNERFEFLGDAVLELAVTHMLCERFHDWAEGELSKLRASTVNQKTLSKIARKLGLGEFILLSRGEQRSRGAEKDSILADTFEAVVASIYLDANFEAAHEFVKKQFDGIFADLKRSRLVVKDYKTQLQEITQARFHITPNYTYIRERGPDHAKEFEVEVIIQDESYGRAWGPSKKEAEQRAAKEAMAKLKAEQE